MLQKRGDVWHTRLMFQGTLYQRSLRTRNKAEAAKLEAVFRASLIRGEFSIVDSRNAPTFTDFEERVLDHIKANVAPRTYGFYKQNVAALKRFAPLASAKLPHIDKGLIDSFVQFRLKEKVTPVTVNHCLRTLRRVLYIARGCQEEEKLAPGVAGSQIRTANETKVLGTADKPYFRELTFNQSDTFIG